MLKKTLLKNLVSILCITFCLFSCAVEERTGEETTENEKIELFFSLDLPVELSLNSSTETGRIDLSDSVLDFIIFEKETSGDYYFAGFVEPVLVNDNTWKVYLENTNNHIHIMILANAGGLYNKQDWIKGETAKEDICKALTTQLQNGIHPDELSIPLWGESQDIIPSPNYKEETQIVLLRMYSAIQIVFDENIPEEEFMLKKVLLYNAHTKGAVIPDAGNWDKKNNRVLAVTIPETPEVSTNITLADNLTGNQMGTVYICESWPVSNEVSRDNVPFLLLGGYYHGETTVTWYRVDFIEEDENGVKSYRPLLRNRLNRLTVSSIGNRGDEDEEEAIKKEKADIEATVTEWDITEGNLLLYGYNILSVSRNNIVLTKEPNQVQVTVYTDYYDGWTAEVREQDRGWLSITSPSPAKGEPNVYTSLNFDVIENETGQDREGKIYIKVGERINYTLFITQEETNIELLVKNDQGVEVHELIFTSKTNSTSTVAQNLNIEWAPGSEICLMTITEGADPFVFHANSDISQGDVSAILQGGGKKLSIRPQPYTAAELAENPFKERVTTLDFIVSTPSSFKKHTVILRHINYHLELRETESVYKIGQTYTVDVYTNVDDWVITTVLDLHGVYKSVTPNKENNTITVVMSDDPQKFDWTAGFFVQSTKASQSDYVNMLAFKTFPNSFMIKPGESVDIPVCIIQAVWRDWLNEGELFSSPTRSTTITLEAVWQTSASKMITIENQSMDLFKSNTYTSPTDYRNAKFKVHTEPGIEGSVLLAAKINNATVWSWHLWITNYDPEIDNVVYTHSGGITSTFMNRNLGASANTAANVNSLGFYYQWGRKDPFPGPSSFTQGNGTTTIKATYNQSGSPVSIPSTVDYQSQPLMNLKQSITNPYVFIVSPNEAQIQDWYSMYPADRNDYLWIDEEGNKGLFDPCPEGWRVPYSSMNRSPWFSISQVTYSNYGYNWTGEVGHFLTCGFRRPQDAKFNSLSFLHTWMSNTSGNQAMGFRAANNVNSTTSYARATGLTVRCIKDNGPQD